jgi:acylphosphatase
MDGFFRARRASSSDKITRLQMSESPVQEGKEALQARLYRVSGTVQGVGFRYFASRAARHLGITGYAKNLHDGRVEVYAIGTPEKLSALRKELQRGPRSAVVSDVTEEDAPIEPEFERDFSIDYYSF